MADRFTEKQGQYLAFIDSYMTMHGRALAEADLDDSRRPPLAPSGCTV